MITENVGGGQGATSGAGSGATKRGTAHHHMHRPQEPTVTLRPADLRFLLPAPPRRAISFDPRVRGALGQAGIDVAPAAGEPVDVVFGTASQVHEHDLARAEAAVMTGRGARRALERAGFLVQEVLVRNGPAGPRLAVPVDGPALTWALLRWGLPHDIVRIARNAAAVAAAKARLPVSLVTVGTRAGATPYPIALAREAVGFPAVGTWAFTPGAGDELQRAVFHVFQPERRDPTTVVKLSRRPGNTRPFDADASGLALAHDAGTVVREHAPVLLGRFLVDGLPASAETAARGRPLFDLLRSPGRRSRKEALIATIAQWFGAVARATASPPDDLAQERDRLASLAPGAPLVAALPPVPAVLAHLDPGTWNIVSDARTFTLLDWEAARRPAFPLWDLMYFLTDAIVVLDGARDAADALARALALFRGEHRDSPLFFALVRDYVATIGLPDDAVGPLAALGWLHHSRSHLARHAALEGFDGGTTLEPSELSHLARIGPSWLDDPRLGLAWTARVA
jgi:hypothetical protein